MAAISQIDKPVRWATKFGPKMTEDDVNRLLTLKPFNQLDPKLYPARTPLREILLNDTRIQNYESGDIIVRNGDYGTTAYIILKGAVHVLTDRSPDRTSPDGNVHSQLRSEPR